MIGDDTHELVYIAFDVVFLAGKGAKEAFQRAGLQPCAVRGCVGAWAGQRVFVCRSVRSIA